MYCDSSLLVFLSFSSLNSLLSSLSLSFSLVQDVWVSSDDGRRWSRLTANAPWTERDNFNAEITSDGLILISGGINTREALNDVWISADGGYSSVSWISFFLPLFYLFLHLSLLPSLLSAWISFSHCYCLFARLFCLLHFLASFDMMTDSLFLFLFVQLGSMQR